MGIVRKIGRVILKALDARKAYRDKYTRLYRELP